MIRCMNEVCTNHLRSPDEGHLFPLQILFHKIRPPILPNSGTLLRSLEQFEAFHSKSNL